MKDIKKIDEKELAVKTPAQAEQILEQEKEANSCRLKKLLSLKSSCWSSLAAGYLVLVVLVVVAAASAAVNANHLPRNLRV